MKIRGNTVTPPVPVVGKKITGGGEIFGDYETNQATAKFATTFGAENKAAAECAIAGGARIFKSGAEYVVARHYFDGETGGTKIAYAAEPNGEYAKNTEEFEEGAPAGVTIECWMNVHEWVAECEELEIPVPDMLMLEDGRFCLLEDLRHNEAYGTGSVAIGKGAVAFSRASKSFGYRTQTGYPPSAEHAAARPEAIVQTDENGNKVYPKDNVGQGAVAFGADTAALGNHAIAGGWESVAKGYNSVALGERTKANGEASFAMGIDSVADGMYSFAMGRNAKVTQSGAVAFGTNNEVKGLYSIAQGAYNTVGEKINAASVFGYHNNATLFAQTVVGSWNKSDTKALFVVGNGSAENKRSNAFVVNNDGSAKVAGRLSFGSIDATSREKVVPCKRSTREPDIGDAGDYIGQIWICYDESDGFTTGVYMYTGENPGGYNWTKLG